MSKVAGGVIVGVEFSASRQPFWPSEDVASIQHEPAVDQPDILPWLPNAWLEESTLRLSPEEVKSALQDKLIACGWLPGETLFAAVEGSIQDPIATRRRTIVGQISRAQYQTLIKRHFAKTLLAHATYGLARKRPWASANIRLSGGQVIAAIVLVLLAISLVATGQLMAMQILLQMASAALFLLVVYLRLLCLLPLPKHRTPLVRPLLNQELPIYTVLVPIFRETEVLPQLLGALNAIDYPPQRVDIKIILEEEDTAMQEALGQEALPPHFDVIIVPSGKPQTKPRALNYALQFARGSLVTIYDGEDVPDPKQLRHAAARFAADNGNLGCLQAALEYYNPGQNWLTQQFSAEYAGLFRVILPTLAAYGLPLPLGGTSNHFRLAALKRVGGWDAFNVTEDADLGIRLTRFGYHTDVLQSRTEEEANSQLGNWLRQRRRWLKGFLQTWLVHMRNPMRLKREIGWRGLLAVQAYTLGTFISALLNPFLAAHAIWTLMPEQIAASSNSLVLQFATAFTLVLFVSGYGVAYAINAIGLRRIGMSFSLWQMLTMPFYWLLATCAAWMAIWDFIVAPFHWHKTQHGLWHRVHARGRESNSSEVILRR